MKNNLRIIIVEDDPLIAFDIKSVVEEGGHEVLGVYHSAKSLLDELPLEIDIALLDINIEGDMDGISLGKFIKEKYKVPCIFITSYYDEKTVKKASKVEPLAYIIKPFEEQDILTNIELSKNKLKGKEKVSSNQPIFVKSGSKLSRIIPSQVTYVQAYDMYTHLYIGSTRVTASQTLKEIEILFSEMNFVRVHRSYMVNIDAIEGICDDEILIGEQRIPIGRTYKKDLFDRIMTI